MIRKLSEPVSVSMTYDHKNSKAYPTKILWQGRIYNIVKIGLHHEFKVGRTLMHIFSVESPSLFFRLSLNTENLAWILEEISDGESN